VPGHPDILIVGGGVIGSACALELALAGRSVVVLEPGGTAGQAWSAAAGLLAAQVETGGAEPLFELGLAGREWYAVHGPALEERTGRGIGLSLDGILQVATGETDAERLRARAAWQQQRGLLCDWLSPEEVAGRWPVLGPSAGALHAPEDGCLDPVLLVEALRAAGRELGVRRVDDRISAVEATGARVVKATGRKTWAFGELVLAAGAWSGRLHGLPRPVSVEPVRGQMAALPRPPGFPDLVAYGHGHYLLTRGPEIIAGSTVEYAGFTPATSEAGITTILRAVGRLCPSLGEARPLRTWAGLRPGTPDGLPIIGREPRTQNLWYATGHGRNGILLAGITAVILRRMMAGEPAPVRVEAFRPERFWQ
jgi:glycine oxidase